MDSSPNFNKKVLDNKYNNDRKPFLASLPVNSKFNLFFIFIIISVFMVILIFVKIPTKIDAFGKIINKNQSEFIILNEINESYYISSINVKKGDLIKDQSYPIVTLSKFNYLINDESINHSKAKINKLKSEIKYFVNQYDLEIEKNHNIILSQKKITSLNNKNRDNKVRQLKMFKDSYEKGNVSKEKYDSKLNEITYIDIELAKLQKESNYLNLNLLRIEKNKKEKIYEIDNLIYTIEQDDLINFSKNNIEIFSPCLNCKVENIMMKDGDLVNRSSPILSLENNNKEQKMYAEIYINSNKYSNINVNSIVKIQLDAFPYLKYGNLEGKIEYISKIPITLDNGENVFLAEARITENKKNIYLNNGMTFKVNIIKDEVPLYKFFTKGVL
jgi:hypothetical protein